MSGTRASKVVLTAVTDVVLLLAGMRDVDDNLGESRKIVRQMMRRMAQNKRIMYIAAACFFIMLISILASKFKPSDPAPVQATPLP